MLKRLIIHAKTEGIGNGIDQCLAVIKILAVDLSPSSAPPVAV